MDDNKLMETLLDLYQKRREINHGFEATIQLVNGLEVKKTGPKETEVDTGQSEKKNPKQRKQQKPFEGLKMYATEIRAIDPQSNKVKSYSGPTITATDELEAWQLLQNTGLGYCKILGELCALIDGDGNDVKEAYRYN